METILPPIAADPATSATSRRPVIATIIDLFFTWIERVRQRNALYELDDRMLRDIGISRADVSHEIDKSFWQL